MHSKKCKPLLITIVSSKYSYSYTTPHHFVKNCFRNELRARMGIIHARSQEKKCQIINFSEFLLFFNKPFLDTGNLF